MSNLFKQACVAGLLTVAVGLSIGCSREEKGPAWVCEPLEVGAEDGQQAQEAAGVCDVRVQGTDMFVRLQRKENNWNILVSHMEGGQVRGELTFVPARKDPVVLEASSRSMTCGPRHCVFPMADDQFSALRKSGGFTVTLTRARIVPQSIKHKKFTEQFGTKGLKQAIKRAGL